MICAKPWFLGGAGVSLLLLVTEAGAQAPIAVEVGKAIIGLIASQIVGKEILDGIYDPLTGRPDTRRMDERLTQMERLMFHVSRNQATLYADLRKRVTPQMSRAEFVEQAEKTMNLSRQLFDLDARAAAQGRQVTEHTERLRKLEADLRRLGEAVKAAPVALPASATATLRVSVSDDDAELWVDGIQRRQTPIGWQLSPGLHYVEIRRKGCADAGRTVYLAPDEKRRLALEPDCPKAPPIAHSPVACVLAGAYPLIEASVDNPTELARARVYFTTSNFAMGGLWYFVEMSLKGNRLEGRMPRPKADIRSLQYYLEIVSLGGEARTGPVEAAVVNRVSDCGSRPLALGGHPRPAIDGRLKTGHHE